MTLRLSVGEHPARPPAGAVDIFADDSGAVSKIDSAGAKSALGGAGHDAWAAAVAAFVKAKVDTLTNVVFRSAFCSGFTQEIERAAVSGTGADATMDATRNGGVLQQDSGTTGNSFRNVRPANSNAAAGLLPNFVSNARTQKWAIAVRCLVGTVGAGCTMSICGMGDESTTQVHLGAAGATSTANWAIIVTGQATQNTGVPLPTAAFTTVVLIADGTNLRAWNVDTGAQIGADAAQVNVAAIPQHPMNNCVNTAAASNKFFLDDWLAITEPAA